MKEKTYLETIKTTINNAIDELPSMQEIKDYGTSNETKLSKDKTIKENVNSARTKASQEIKPAYK